MRFVFSALAWFLAIWLSLTCLATLFLLGAVMVRLVDDRFTLGLALMAGGVTVLLGSFFGVLLVRTIRHIRKPDQKTARDVAAIACFVVGGLVLRGLWRQASPVLKEQGVATYWQVAAVLVSAVILLAIYRYVMRPIGDRAYAPRTASRDSN